MSEKVAVPYPQLLDNFGQQLQQMIKNLNADSLKPAIMADIRKTVELMFMVQQLLVMMYNLNVANYEVQMKKMVKLEEDLDDLKTKCAGYSERLNQLEAKVSKGGKENG